MSLAGASSSSGVDSLRTERALGALAHGPREPRRQWVTADAALGFVNKGQLASYGNSALVWEGRIDNRASLTAALSTASAAPSDADLLWLAWRQWGKDFLDHVYGEFACALWDADDQILVLGRDALGLRPLYYWVNGDELAFATEPRGLWSDDRITKAVNTKRLGMWLAITPFPDSQTLHQDIHRVLPGEITLWSGGKVTSHRYWRPECQPLLRLDNDDAYSDGLREKLDAAVRRCLPASGEIGCQLSGGLDSSSIAVLAARALAENGRRITAFTAAPAGPVDNALTQLVDEFPAAGEVAGRHSNMDHVRIANYEISMARAMELYTATTELPVLNVTNAPWGHAIDAEARRRKVKVLLTGIHGNLTLSYAGWSLLPALLRRGRVLALIRTCAEIRKGPDRQTWLSLASLSIGPLLPASVMRFIRRTMQGAVESLSDYTTLSPAFAAQSGIDILEISSQAHRRQRDGRTRRIAALHKLDFLGDFYAGMHRFQGFELAHPALDRELVEFCLAVPEEQYLHNGEIRSLARRAMKGLLPDSILSDRRRGQQSADWRNEMENSRPDLERELAALEKSPVAALCLDLPRMRQMLEDWPKQDWTRESVRNAYRMAFARGIAAGHFIRRLEGGNA